MQTVADQILQDTERQNDGLGSASAAATEMLDWLHGCKVDARRVVDAAARVEQIGKGIGQVPNRLVADSCELDDQVVPAEELRRGSHSPDALPTTTVHHQHLRATIDEGERLQSAVRSAVDVARRIRTAAEALRGHAQTLQLIALDLHAQGGAGRGFGPHGASDAEKASRATPTGHPQV
jgi:hypothetical protein